MAPSTTPALHLLPLRMALGERHINTTSEPSKVEDEKETSVGKIEEKREEEARSISATTIALADTEDSSELLEMKSIERSEVESSIENSSESSIQQNENGNHQERNSTSQSAAHMPAEDRQADK